MARPREERPANRRNLADGRGKRALSPPFGPPQGGMRLLSAKRLSHQATSSPSTRTNDWGRGPNSCEGTTFSVYVALTYIPGGGLTADGVFSSDSHSS